MRIWHALIGAVMLAVASPIPAKVPKEQADRLLQPNGDLTPLGAEKAGN